MFSCGSVESESSEEALSSEREREPAGEKKVREGEQRGADERERHRENVFAQRTADFEPAARRSNAVEELLHNTVLLIYSLREYTDTAICTISRETNECIENKIDTRVIKSETRRDRTVKCEIPNFRFR